MKKRACILGWLLAVLVLLAGPALAQGTAFQHYDQGLRLAAQGQLAQAKAAFDQALRLDPQALPVLRCQAVLADVDRRIKPQTAVHLFRAFLAFNQYKTDQAIAELNQAAQLDPNYAPIYSHRADAFQEKRQPQQALADFDKALALDPRYVVAYVNRANLRAAQGQTDAALADYGQALALEPRNIPALYGRGNTLGKLGRHQQAIADYDALLAANPAYPHAYVRKGLAWEALGRRPEALAAYQAYLQRLNLARQDPQQVKWVEDKVKALTGP